jgi:hypothetical protein
MHEKQRKGEGLMNGRKGIVVILMVVSVSLMTSCAASMKLVSVWKDDTYRGEHFRKLLVIGTAEKPGVRRFFEDEFVDQFRARGIQAVASYTLIPIDKVTDKETIAEKIKGQEIEAVLITRLVNKRVIESYRPAGERFVVPHSSYSDWHQYYADSIRFSAAPTYTVKKEVSLETNLYETMNEKLVWSGLTRMTLENERDTQVKEYVTLIIKTLLSDEKMFK